MVTPHSHDVAIRLAEPQDATTVAELAEIDSAPHFAERGGPVLLAESDGRAVAALDVERGTAVADPFEPSAPLVDLLRLRARQLDRRDRRALRTVNG
jgi:hypothetical protein